MTVLHNEEHPEKHSFDFFCCLTFQLNHLNKGKVKLQTQEKTKNISLETHSNTGIFTMYIGLIVRIV